METWANDIQLNKEHFLGNSSRLHQCQVCRVGLGGCSLCIRHLFPLSFSLKRLHHSAAHSFGHWARTHLVERKAGCLCHVYWFFLLVQAVFKVKFPQTLEGLW